ncbi:MAG TPA: hypothetical protein VFE60_09240 [Roseiarcus sp.]|jgi:hypothetical protein|nr:hypothetical protein [Roseiarcus sp.]
MSAVVQFMSPADHVLGIEERLVELVDHLVEFHQRLDTLEAIAVENAGVGGDPLAAILARLDSAAPLRSRSQSWRTCLSVPRRNVSSMPLGGAWTSCRANSPPNDTSALAANVISTSGSTNARRKMRERVAAIETRTADKGE